MKIGINCGHTLNGAGSGAVGLINESEHTRKVGKALINLLLENGHSVIDCTVDKADTQAAYLSQAVKIANKQKLDLFVSIHFNASNGNGKGTEIFTYTGKKTDAATRTLSNLTSLGFKDRGIKDGSGLYVIKHTQAEAMLIEVCFCDNKADVENYNALGYNVIAKAIYKGITGKAYKDETPIKKSELTDIKGHYAEKHIQKLFDYGIVNGDGNGNFFPNKNITRAEAAVMVANALQYLGK